MFALRLGVQSSQAADALTLTVSYNTDCIFHMSGTNGVPVAEDLDDDTLLPPGIYQVVVNTPFPFANGTATCASVLFQLSGPGLTLSSNLGVGNLTSSQYTATFLPNSTYTAQDNNQPARTLKVFHTMGSGPSSGASSSTSGSTPSSSKSSGNSSAGTSGVSAVGTPLKAAPLQGTLTGALSSTGKLTLTRDGKDVSNLKSGLYKIVVTDKTAKGGFTVQEIRKKSVALTGAAFVGKRTVKVDLKAGQWMAYSAIGKKYYFIVIT